MCSIEWWHCWWPWVTPNHPFLHFAAFISPLWVMLLTSDMVDRLTIACPSLPMTNRPWKGRGHLTSFRILHPMSAVLRVITVLSASFSICLTPLWVTVEVGLDLWLKLLWCSKNPVTCNALDGEYIVWDASIFFCVLFYCNLFIVVRVASCNTYIGWAKKLQIFKSPYWCNCSRYKKMDMATIFLEFPRKMIRVHCLCGC